jgi:hypothetical protein
MFKMYIDDSGTSDGQTIAIASGLIVPHLAVSALEREWEIFRRREKFNDFHAAKCAFGNYKSEFRDWDKKRVKRVFHRVREIAKKYGEHAYSFAIRKCEYDELIPKELRELGGDRHYTWAVRHLLSATEQVTAGIDAPAPIEFIFDWMDESSPHRKEIETTMRQAESITPGRYVNHYSFRHREEVPGLQCADMLAWSCYKFAVHIYDKTPLTELAERSYWDFENFRNGLWMSAVVQTRAQLLDWVQRELNDPREQERIRLRCGSCVVPPRVRC